MQWFFDVYLYQSALPELLVTRENELITFEWKVPEDLHFPMPVELKVNEKVITLEMKSGQATASVPVDARVTIDPLSKILRHSKAIEEFRAWQESQKNDGDLD